MAIKRRIGKREICSRNQFFDAYYRPYAAKKALAVLDAHQVFPLTYENPVLSYLNVLGLHCYFSGAIMEERIVGRSHSFRACISGGREQQRNLTEIVQMSLGLTLRGKRDQLFFGENGSTYARLLSLMGFHTTGEQSQNHGRKAKTGSQLPPYLTDIIDGYDALADIDRAVCRKHIRDFILVLFDTKTSILHRTNVYIDLLVQPSKDLTIKQGAQIIHAFNIMYPKVGIRADQLDYIQYSGGNFGGRILIPADQTALFRKFYGRACTDPPIMIELKLSESRYSFDLAKKNCPTHG